MKKSKSTDTAILILVSILAVLFVFPIFWMILSSFKGGSELFELPARMIPKRFSISNYIEALNYGNFFRYSMNSLFLAVTATVVTLVINSLAGYSLAKLKFTGKNFFFILLMSAAMVPGESILYGTLEVVINLGLYDNYMALILTSVATPTGVFMLRQFFVYLPNEYLEAARVEGLGEFRIFLMLLPLAKSVLATLAIFSFMWRWNDLIFPLMVISSPEKYTVQIGIANLIGEYRVDWHRLIASSTLSMIPMIIIFFMFQRYLMNYNIGSGVKG
jgi:alpha-1,4-digalacturonate transport system permease protein